jgi:hypothetical protein
MERQHGLYLVRVGVSYRHTASNWLSCHAHAPVIFVRVNRLNCFHSALNVYSKMVFNLKRFDVTHNTTYDQYVYASTPQRIFYFLLLPPGYPTPTLSFPFETMDYRLHKHCPGKGSWTGTLRRTFRSIDDAVRDLASCEDTYWCRHCGKGLFFGNTCPTLFTDTSSL